MKFQDNLKNPFPNEAERPCGGKATGQTLDQVGLNRPRGEGNKREFSYQCSDTKGPEIEVLGHAGGASRLQRGCHVRYRGGLESQQESWKWHSGAWSKSPGQQGDAGGL